MMQTYSKYSNTANKILKSYIQNVQFLFSSSCIQYVMVRFAPCGAVVSR